MASDLDFLVGDLADEQQALDNVVAAFEDSQWESPTPSAGWRVRDQIAHLAYFDTAAVTALQDPERFAAERSALVEAISRGESAHELTIGTYDTAKPSELAQACVRLRSEATRDLLRAARR